MDVSQIDKLQKAMKQYSGNTEKVINDVLHNEVSEMVQESIRNLIPVSNVKPWSGKLPHAKNSKSLTDQKGNLSLTVKTTKRYQYLYFPDDGTSTKNHAGNQQFFKKGGEAKQDEIIDRCVLRLTESFEV